LLAQRTGDYSISGAVLNAQNSKPVKCALITLSFPIFDPSESAEYAKPHAHATIVENASLSAPMPKE